VYRDRSKKDSASTRADTFAGVNAKKKASARSARNDRFTVARKTKETERGRSIARTWGAAGWAPTYFLRAVCACYVVRRLAEMGWSCQALSW
jgi:hypothetical protein